MLFYGQTVGQLYTVYSHHDITLQADSIAYLSFKTTVDHIEWSDRRRVGYVLYRCIPPHDIVLSVIQNHSGTISFVDNFLFCSGCKHYKKYLPCSFNLGSGPVSVLTNKTFNDGDWHTVTIQRNKASGTLVVDKGEGHMATAPGAMKSLDINNGIFLGEF